MALPTRTAVLYIVVCAALSCGIACAKRHAPDLTVEPPTRDIARDARGNSERGAATPASREPGRGSARSSRDVGQPEATDTERTGSPAAAIGTSGGETPARGVRPGSVIVT